MSERPPNVLQAFAAVGYLLHIGAWSSEERYLAAIEDYLCEKEKRNADLEVENHHLREALRVFVDPNNTGFFGSGLSDDEIAFDMHIGGDPSSGGDEYATNVTVGDIRRATALLVPGQAFRPKPAQLSRESSSGENAKAPVSPMGDGNV